MSFEQTNRLNQPFKVEIVHSSPSPDEDITEYITAIEKLIDTTDGDVPTATLTVNTRDGAFLSHTKDGGSDLSGPAIDQFTLLRIEMQDDSAAKYERIMYVDEIEPQQGIHGQTMDLHLFGREMYLKHVKFTGHYYFVSAKSVIQDIIGFYNDNKGTSQPVLSSDIDVPDYPAGIFDFGKETNCYDALRLVLARLSLPVAGGGAADYFDMRFEEVANTPGTIMVRIFSMGSRTTVPRSGSTPAGIVVEKHAHTQYITETREPITANMVIVEGAADSGTTPRRVSQFSHAIEIYNNFPLHNQAAAYPVAGIYVRKDTFINDVTDVSGSTPYDPDNKVYVSRRSVPANTPLTSSTHWRRVSIAAFVNDDRFGLSDEDKLGYSPWTQGRRGALLKSCSDDSALQFTPGNRHPQAGDIAVPDGNLVIKDGTHYRNWVNVRVNNPADIPSAYLYNADASNHASRIPDDFRVLVDSSLGSPSANVFYKNGAWQTDRFGRSYKDAIAQFRRTTVRPDGEWIVVHLPFVEMECAVRHEGEVYWFRRDLSTGDRRPPLYADDDNASYKFAVSGTASWHSMLADGVWFGNDCFHYPSRVENVKGLVYPYDRTSSIKFSDTSAVYWEYQWGTYFDPSLVAFSLLRIAGAILEPIWSSLINRLYCLGSWAVLFEAPFPPRSSGDPGSIFGGKGKYRQSVLDLNNLTYTPSAKRGWGASDAEELGPITGISFWVRFVVGLKPPLDGGLTTDNPSFAPIPGGDFTKSVFLYDTEDNVWRAQYTYRFAGETQIVVLPASAFKIYRARNPIALTTKDYVQNVLTPELKILEIFEKRKVRLITHQWDESYDSDGRYDPISAERLLWRLLGRAWTGDSAYTGLWIDNFCFTHAPFVRMPQEGPPDDMHYADNIIPYPSVSNVVQLRSVAKAELDLAMFRRDVFTVRTTGRCDLRAGDYCYLYDEDVLPQTSHDRPVLTSTGAQRTTRPPNHPRAVIKDGRYYYEQHTRKLVVRSVTYAVNSRDGPGGYITDIVLADRIGF